MLLKRMVCVLVLLLITLQSSCARQEVVSQEFQGMKDPWFELQRFEGIWKEEQVVSMTLFQVGQLGSCNPCQYMVQLYSNQLKITVYNWQHPNDVYVYSDQMSTEDDYVFLERSITTSSIKDEVKVTFKPVDGYNIKIEFAIYNFGLYIVHEETLNTYLLPVLSIVYSAISYVIYQLHHEFIGNLFVETEKRICTLLVVLTAQVGTIIIVYQGCMVIEYLLNYDSFVGKIAFYLIFGHSLLIQMVQVGYIYAIVQKKFQKYYPQVETNNSKKLIKRLLFFMFIFVVCILLYPVLLIIFHKQIWFSYFFTIFGLLAQFFISIRRQVLPYNRFILFYLLNICYLTILSNYYPIFNFHQSNRLHLFIFFTFTGGLFLGGSYVVKKKILQVRLDEDNREDGKNKAANFSLQTQDMIKSDIQLDPRAI